MQQLEGSCGCGSVQYKLNSEIMNVVNCHCNMCRKHNGSAFSTYAALPFKSLQITQGDALIKHYSLDIAKKHFCNKCGTPLYNTNDHYPGACMIYSGTLNTSNTLTPGINVWCESQLAWLNELSAISSLPQGVPTNRR